MQPLKPVPSAPASRPKRAAVTAPALVSAVVVVASVLVGCSPGHRARRSTPTSAPPPATSTTTEAPPQYAPSPYSWDRAADASLAVGGGHSATLSALLAPQLVGSWMLFGSRLAADGTPSPTVWTSPDGTAWTAVPLASGTNGAGRAAAAAEYRMATVVVGSVGSGPGSQAAVWLSTAADQPFTAQTVPAGDGPSAMSLVTAGALGMFATGTVDGRFAMWSSTNGRRWSELPNAERLITGSPGARVNALLAAGDFVYAAGSIQTGAAQQAALWATADGLNWHLVDGSDPAFSGPGGRAIYSLAPLGTGLVAVGAVDEGSGWTPASWISPDGQSWSLPSVDFAGLPHTPGRQVGALGGTAARAVSAIATLAGPTSVVAAGGGPYGQQAWRSSDGLHWNAVGLPSADASATSWRAELAAATTTTTVVADGEPGQPYLLTESKPSAAQPGTWAQPSSDPTVFGPVRADAVPLALRASGGRLGLSVELLVRPQTIGPASVAREDFSSADGRSWTSLPGGSGADGPPTVPAPGAVTTRVPGGWVAVAPGSSPVVWTSSTGLLWRRAAVLSAPTAAPPGTTTTTGSGLSGTTPAAGATAGTGGPAGGTGGGPAGGPAATVNGTCAARIPANSGSAATSATTAAGSRFVVAAVGASTTPSAPAGTGTGSATGGAGGSGAAGSPSVGALSTPLIVNTRAGAAWVSPTGAVWRPAAVTPVPPTGATQSVSGCLGLSSGLVAYGVSAGSGGAPQPAVWRSPDATAWSRVPVSAFSAGPASPLLSLASDGAYWLAAANPDPGADPLTPGVAGATGPAATAGGDASVGPPASVQDGRDALWLSLNGGSAWQLLNTSAAPWLGAEQTELDLVGFVPAPTPSAPSARHAAEAATTSTTAGGSSPGAANVPAAVVVGTVDGQLAVWVGTAAQPSSSSTTG